MQIGNILIPLDWNERIFTACRLRFLTTSTHFIHPHSPGGKNGWWGKKRQDISPRDAVERYDMRYAVLFDAGGFLGKGFRLKEKLVHLVDFDVVGIGHQAMTRNAPAGGIGRNHRRKPIRSSYNARASVEVLKIRKYCAYLEWHEHPGIGQVAVHTPCRVSYTRVP